MSKADYKADFSTMEVKCKDVLVATFNEDGDIEFTEDGMRRKRWIQEALKEQKPKKPVEKGPKEDVSDADIMDIRMGRKRMEDVFYDVPDPEGNMIGRDHEQIVAWVEENYPEHVEMLYPRGRYDPDKAGVGKINLAVQVSTASGNDGFNMA